MAKAQKIYPPNRLADAVDTQNGESPQRLISKAGELVVALRPRIRAFVNARVEKLAAYATATDEVLMAEGATIGAMALAVAEVASAGDMETVGEVARGTSAVVNSLLEKGSWHSTAVRIHLQSLLLASQQAEGPAAERLMLDRLRIMRKVLGVSE